jgi:hypothetical protein
METVELFERPINENSKKMTIGRPRSRYRLIEGSEHALKLNLSQLINIK